MPATRTVAMMHRVTEETAAMIRSLQAAWGVPGKPLSAAATVAEAIRRAHERESKPGRTRGK